MNEHIINRLAKLRKKMDAKGLDAVLVLMRENCTYLSGFTGTSACLVISRGDAILITDFRYAEQASLQAPLYEIVKYEGNAVAAIGEVLKSRGMDKVGFEETYLAYNKYIEYREKLGIKEFLPLEGAIENLRMVKDEKEINIIKKAVEIADNAFAHVLKYIKPGVSEIDIAAEIEYFMRKSGAFKASFDTIVASGERSSMPHGVASERKLKHKDAVTLDFGALYSDYCSDMTRTIFLGIVDNEMKKIYNIVLDAQLKAIEGAFSGLSGREIDKIARDAINKAGYGNNFGHGLGHGVGLQIHEEPRFSPNGHIEMKDGMVMTVEPGIYIKGYGGVRIEDIIVINGSEPVILTKSAKDMIII